MCIHMYYVYVYIYILNLLTFTGTQTLQTPLKPTETSPNFPNPEANRESCVRNPISKLKLKSPSKLYRESQKVGTWV